MFDGKSTEDLSKLRHRWHLEAQSATDSPKLSLAADAWKTRSLRGLSWQFVDTPFELEERLRAVVRVGASARLLASYARKWKTGGAADPHRFPPNSQDFHEAVQVNGEIRYWSKPWNFVPKGGTDYTAFIQASPGYPIADDPLCEVGCPYVVRGFDFDYIGVLWLSDLVYRAGRWDVQLEHVHESGLTPVLKRARSEGLERGGPGHAELLESMIQAYRILLTRAIHGVVVWVEDPETREYLTDRFKSG